MRSLGFLRRFLTGFLTGFLMDVSGNVPSALSMSHSLECPWNVPGQVGPWGWSSLAQCQVSLPWQGWVGMGSRSLQNPSGVRGPWWNLGDAFSRGLSLALRAFPVLPTDFSLDNQDVLQ